MYRIDTVLTQAINGLAGTSVVIDDLVIWISILGVPLMVLAVALQWWRRADRPHVRHAVVAAGLTFLLGLALNQFILQFIHRLRPYDDGITHLLIARSADFSFPSDHATAAFAIAAAFLLRGLRRTGLWFLAASILVMISRVYIGTHFISDVLGGAMTAVAAALLVRALYWQGTRADRLITGIL